MIKSIRIKVVITKKNDLKEDITELMELMMNIPALVSSESGIWKPRFRRLGNRSSGNWEPVIR